MRCNLPPPGWFCTIAAPHDGPCAAWPDDPRDIPAGVIEDANQAFRDLAYATEADRVRFRPSKLKMKLRLFLIVLGGGGPALLFLADRIGHFFGLCLGF